MPKIELIEKPDYYKLPNIRFTDRLFFFDAVKKVIKFDLDVFWVTVVGGVELNQGEPKYTNAFCFYINSYYTKKNPRFFESLRKFGLEIACIFENEKSIIEYILKLKEMKSDHVFGIYSKIDEDSIYDIRDFAERYTTEYMLKLEACCISYFCSNLEGRNIVISDGVLSKFEGFEINPETILVGLIKDVERNYLSELGAHYLYALPFGSRSCAFYLLKNNFKVLSFYVNIGKIIRVEVLQDNLEELIKVSSYIFELSNIPVLYYRMPQNNIVLTKLERKLKSYIMNDIVYTKLV